MGKIYKLHSANIYMDNTNYAQVAEEITLPEVKYKTTTHAPTALSGSVDIPLVREPMSITIKGDFDPAFIAAASDTKHTHSLQIYSDLVEFEGGKGRAAESQVVAFLKVTFTGQKIDPFKHGEVAKVEYTASVWAYKLAIEGVVEYDFDITSNKDEVMGFDLNATQNEILAT